MRRSMKRNPDVTDRDVDDAVRVIRADYYQDVRDVAHSLAQRMKAGKIEEFSDALHEEVEGTQRVIYTWRARLGLLATDNADAYAEEFGEVPVQGDSINYEAMMATAMQQDVVERLDAGGVDVNDPDSWEEIDLREFEEE